MSVNIYVIDNSAFARNFLNSSTSILEAEKYFLKQKIRDDILNDQSNQYGALIYFNQNPQIGMPLSNIKLALESSIDLAKFYSQTTIVNKHLSCDNFLQTLNYAILALSERTVKNSEQRIVFIIASYVAFNESLKPDMEKLRQEGIRLTLLFVGKYAAKCYEDFMKFFPSDLGVAHLCLDEISDGTRSQKLGEAFGYDEENDFELQQILQLSAQEYQQAQEKMLREATDQKKNDGSSNDGQDFAGFM